MWFDFSSFFTFSHPQQFFKLVNSTFSVVKPLPFLPHKSLRSPQCCPMSLCPCGVAQPEVPAAPAPAAERSEEKVFAQSAKKKSKRKKKSDGMGAMEDVRGWGAQIC